MVAAGIPARMGRELMAQTLPRLDHGHATLDQEARGKAAREVPDIAGNEGASEPAPDASLLSLLKMPACHAILAR